jgi:hypothetical protein
MISSAAGLWDKNKKDFEITHYVQHSNIQLGDPK